MNKVQTAVATLAFGLSASSALAAVVTIDSVAGEWVSTAPGDVYGLDISTTADATRVEWGDPVFDNKSAYTFEGIIPPSIEVDTSASTEFDLGVFTHDNFRIWMDPPSGAYSIDSANLSVDFDFSIDGNDYSLNQVYTFEHDETPNGRVRTCAYGDAPGQGVNGSYGCADRVTAVLNEGLSESIILDGLEYVFDISGFRYDDETFSYFMTRESQENEAILVGSLRVSPVSEVPLPASGVLLLGGLAGLVMARRRRG